MPLPSAVALHRRLRPADEKVNELQLGKNAAGYIVWDVK